MVKLAEVFYAENASRSSVNRFSEVSDTKRRVTHRKDGTTHPVTTRIYNLISHATRRQTTRVSLQKEVTQGLSTIKVPTLPDMDRNGIHIGADFARESVSRSETRFTGRRNTKQKS